MRDKQGDERVFLVSALPMFHPDTGRFEGIRGTARDITERGRTERALERSEDRFRRVFEDTAIGTAVASLEGRYLQVNRALCEMLGYSEDELLQKRFHDVSHPEDRETNDLVWKRAVAGEIDRYELEKRYIHKDGQVIWGQVSVSVITDPDGKPLYTIAQHQDITERRRAELTLHEAHQALEQRVAERTEELRTEIAERERAEASIRESEERFRVIAETSPVAILISRLSDGAVLFANERAGELVDFATEDILGRPILEVVNGAKEALLITGEGIRDRELELRRADGSMTFCAYSTHPMVLGGESVLLFAIMDITDVRESQAQLAQAARLATLGEMASGIAHELNPAAQHHRHGRRACAHEHGGGSVAT